MKNVLIAISIVALLLLGVFFWKGGHHAIFVYNVLEEWLDAEAGDQSLHIQVQLPDLSKNDTTGQLQVRQWIITADSFWTEYADDHIYGLSANGITAYLREGIVYMDTGRAYSLPELPDLRSAFGRLTAGLLLCGRVTKTDDIYTLTMKTEELDLSASVTIDRAIRLLTVSASMPDGSAFHGTLTPRETQAHSVPKPVADAMVLARMERPVSLEEPLNVLMPALEDLFPLSGALELGISSGILELSETVDLSIAGNQATISRGGILVDVDLPSDFSHLSPAAGALFALRSGTFTKNGDTATVTISLPADTAAALAESLVPQAANLGISFAESTLELIIHSGRLTGASIRASGSVPFLITSIPLTFSANLTIT